MGVTFCGNFASGTLLVPFHWRGMCYAHRFSREGSLCVREAEETAPDPVGLHKLNFNHTCCAGHRNNDTARRHLARSAYLLFLRGVADTSPPRAEGNHPNPCLPLRGRPLLIAQGDKDGFARRSASTTTSNRSGTYLNRILDLVSLPTYHANSHEAGAFETVRRLAARLRPPSGTPRQRERYKFCGRSPKTAAICMVTDGIFILIFFQD